MSLPDPHSFEPTESVPARQDSQEFVGESKGDDDLQTIDQLLSCVLKPRPELDRPPSGETDKDHALGVQLPERFQQLRMLGSGTFGVVFLCYDQRIGREVAVKILRPEWMTNPEKRQRFLREARAAARLNHSNAVRILEADQNDSMAWLVCDAIDGATLSTHLRSVGALPHRIAARLMAELAEAVEYAHQLGIIHRDIKPDNILISGVPAAKLDDAHAHLTDFGLAKILDDDLDLSRSGTLLGTPRYMAPEQFDESSTHNQPAAVDVYSLGVVLFECLTGQCPFSKASTLANRVRLGLYSHPSPLSINPTLSKDLDSICMKAMEPQSQNRYATAGELAQDLRNYLLDLPILARPLSPLQRLGRLARRNRLIAALVSVIGIGLVCIAAGLLVANLTFKRTNRALTDSMQQLASEKLRAQQMAVEAEKSQQRFQKLAWNSEVSQLYLDQENNRWFATQSRLNELKAEFPDATDRLEWQLLRTQFADDFQLLLKLDAPINQVRPIPISSLVAAAGGDGQVYMVDVATRQTVSQFDSDMPSLHSLAVHPIQSVLAVGGESHGESAPRPALFDWKSQTRLDQLQRFPSTVESLEYSADGRYLFCGSRYEELMLVDLQENRFDRYPGSRRNTWLTYLKSMQLFAYQKDDSTIALVRPGRAEIVRELLLAKALGHNRVLLAAEIPNTTLLAVAVTKESAVWIVDTISGLVVATLNHGSDDYASCIVADPSGTLLACGFPNGQVHVFRLDDLGLGSYLSSLGDIEAVDSGTNQMIETVVHLNHSEPLLRSPELQWRLFSSSVTDLAFSEDRLVCCSEGGEMLSLGLPANTLVQAQSLDTSVPIDSFRESTIPRFQRKVIEATWAKSKPVVAVNFFGLHVLRLDLHELEDNHAIDVTGNTSRELSPNSSVQEWPLLTLATPDRLLPWATFNRGGSEIAISDDALTIVCGTAASELGVWHDGQSQILSLDLSTDREQGTMSVISLSPDNKCLALMTQPRVVQVRELAVPGRLKAQYNVTGTVCCVDWHPDGKTIALGGDFPHVMVCDLETGSIQKILEHTTGTRAIRYLDHGRLFLSSHVNGTIRFTSTEDGSSQPVAMHETEIASMAFSSDESIGVSIDRANKIVLWSVPFRRRFGVLYDLNRLNEDNTYVEGTSLWLAPDASQLLVLFDSTQGPRIRRWKLK